jgi:3'-phosphoadenosine 5'-phosphosulfate sulfotransferase (PAPS reductase)/FAD synthetase
MHPVGVKVIPIHLAGEQAVAEPDLFGLAPTATRFGIDLTPEIDSVLDAGAPVFVSVSGGKDSQALAYRVAEHLDDIGHQGERYLIHADLGRVEWRDSMPLCERLATRLGLELIVVRRKAGDLMDRWLSRWTANVGRFSELQCVKLILPWSTPTSRFCTGELKGQRIAAEIRRRFPVGDVVSAVGIRREESSRRAHMPVWKQDDRTTRKRGLGHTWNAILGWARADVTDYVRMQSDTLHEAYRTYGSTRLSCTYCILASERDLRAARNCSDNHEIYREMCQLEIQSTFSFQGNRWLSDIAPDLLTPGMRADLKAAKERALARIAAEARLPEHLLFVKGWPTCMPSPQEAQLIAEIRVDVARAVGLQINYTDRDSVEARYRELIAAAVTKAAVGGLALST